MSRAVRHVLTFALLFSACAMPGKVANAGNAEDREAASIELKARNYDAALKTYRRLLFRPDEGETDAAKDLVLAVECLGSLYRRDEADELVNLVLARHKSSWRILLAAARIYDREVYPFAARPVRSRVRALQLLEEGLDLVRNEPDKVAAAAYYQTFAIILRYSNSWYRHGSSLQSLTDLSRLPEENDGYVWHWGLSKGAPVDIEGRPLFFPVPARYEDSANDGERWRWMLEKAAELDPKQRDWTRWVYAEYLQSQFGVQTAAGWGRVQDDLKGDFANGPYAMQTLSDDETIARLATGVKRFTLPKEFNPIAVYQELADQGQSWEAKQARTALAATYQNRRQYAKAAEAWRRAIQKDADSGGCQHALDQIVGGWGRFEFAQVQPAGRGATVEYRYRNGRRVTFEAYELDVSLLLEDVKAYVKSSPKDFDPRNTNIEDIGFGVVNDDQKRYIKRKVADWSLELKPRPGHEDDRITITTPLQKPGAYLLTGKMAQGNTSRIVLLVNDTVIVKSQIPGRPYYYVADATTGTPIPKAHLEFFGWRVKRWGERDKKTIVETVDFAEVTDREGQVMPPIARQPMNHDWLIVARTDAGRFAYLGPTGAWYGRLGDDGYRATKVFGITDRPVYRPQQKVQFKFWAAEAKFDQRGLQSFSGRPLKVSIECPQHQTVFEIESKCDAFGGISGEFELPCGAPLGIYTVAVAGRVEDERVGGQCSFRVEEYKKPEFEVRIDAPVTPVLLGDKFTATIEAKYYFGAPVTKAKVKYKVLRTTYDGRWYPRGTWDWCYGRGYWWFAPAYAWYPGWQNWGCCGSHGWWPQMPAGPPEVVHDNEVEIGPDGKVTVDIDTALAKAQHSDEDHQYSITAEVADESRRTIVASRNVLVGRRPFEVSAWVDRGYYHVGDLIEAQFDVHTLDHQPVTGRGKLTLVRISYNQFQKPVERNVEMWDLSSDAQGTAAQRFKAAEPGQYRLSYHVTDGQQRTVEGGYVFVVIGKNFDGRQFQYNDLELITDQREYAPGDKVRLLVNTNRVGSTVVLFVRPKDGARRMPQVLRLAGKSTIVDVDVDPRDMPNFFIEAFTISEGKLYSEAREVFVPPQQHVLNVDVLPAKPELKPGSDAKVRVRLTDLAGRPFVGSTVLSVYDKSVEYVSGGTNIPEIREFFWKWRRTGGGGMESNLDVWTYNVIRANETPMSNRGLFGEALDQEAGQGDFMARKKQRIRAGVQRLTARAHLDRSRVRWRKLDELENVVDDVGFNLANAEVAMDAGGIADDNRVVDVVQPTIRRNFADTAFWAAAVLTGEDGEAEISFKMPESLTAWKVKAWAMGRGTRVGQGEAEVTTSKNLLVRLQAPRFFVQSDEIMLSANVHNYHPRQKAVRIMLELEGGTLSPLGTTSKMVSIASRGEARVDWRVKVTAEGGALVRTKALTNEESDGMEMRFPVYVHGLPKQESYSGLIRPKGDKAQVTFDVPAERRVAESRIEVRYTPTLAGAMVDALPYLAACSFECTEIELNRFLPAVVTQNILLRMKLDLKEIRAKQVNLNAQELGDDRERSRRRFNINQNPVFDVNELHRVVRAGLDKLTTMQLADGGWGWKSEAGEHSDAHCTAVIVHGLQVAKQNGVLVPRGLENGEAWLKAYQGRQVRLLQNAPDRIERWKAQADELDALVFMVLVDADIVDADMLGFLYRDFRQLSVYGRALLGLALHRRQEPEKVAAILENLRGFQVVDPENQTVYLNLRDHVPWWYWYGGEIEANAFYLKLLCRVEPQGEAASGLAKYLLNNRRHGTYWNSTRDTALVIEALAEYMQASGEDHPDMRLEVFLDGEKRKDVKIDASNLFAFDNKLVLSGDAVTTGRHTLEFRRAGVGPLYFNAYVTNFTLEDFITRAGLEVKVNRKYYRLKTAERLVKVQDARARDLDQKSEKHERGELEKLAMLNSGDLVEIELEIVSKNDYEYLVVEDMKPSGFESVELRSGYDGNSLNAYRELRDEKVSYFVRWLPRGTHKVSYRLRAEIPGKISALPARVYAMYAPELKGNSDEIKLTVEDR